MRAAKAVQAKTRNATEAFEKELRERPPEKDRHELRLYVTGMTPRSTAALATIKAICEEHLAGRYELEVIDMYQQPALAKDEQIVASPTLVRLLPAPIRRFIGNLSDRDRVLLALDLLRRGD